jgi:hypothetical protein
MSDRQMTLQELQSGDGAFVREECLRNYKYILNRINNHFGWESDIVYYDRLNQHASDLPGLCKELWNITSLAALKQKISAISSLMTRTRFGGDHEVRSVVRTADRLQHVEVKNAVKKIPDWETDLLPKLQQLASGSGVCGTIAKVFSYGYVLRVGSLFTTKLVDDGISNYLDLDNCKWSVRNQKNRKLLEFSVDPELCKQIPKGTWLLTKGDGEPYCKSARTLKYHGWTLPDNNTIRKSYETWNINKSGRDKNCSDLWHAILGHTPIVAKDFYNHPSKSIKKKLDKVLPIPKNVDEVEMAKIKVIIKKR